MDFIQSLFSFFYKFCPALLFFAVGAVTLPSFLNAKEIKAVIKVPELHIVKEGENLWDLSARTYEDPYQWRSIWEKNTYVDKPELIYPGDLLYLPGRFVEKEVVQILQDDLRPEKEAHDPVPIPPSSLAPPNPDPLEILSDARLRTAGYIVPDEKEWDGSILYGKKEKTIFSTGDSVFIQLNLDSASVGDKFTIVHVVKEVKHPESGDSLGSLIQEVGALSITEKEGQIYSALIIKSNSLIDSENFLIKSEEREKPLRELMVIREEKDIEGIIITGQEERFTQGLNSIVYINVGSEHGLAIGDRFVVYKGGEKVKTGWFRKDEAAKPKIIYGKIEVFTVQPSTSTAIVVESSKEIFGGAKIAFTKK